MQRNVVGGPPEPIRFDNILGRLEYEHVVQQLYREHAEAWLTPAELFAPWYSYALATLMLERHDASVPLRIVEIGAGNGTNAAYICSFIKQHRPRLYQSMTYTSVEISPLLAERQRRRLARHADVFECVQMDALELGTLKESLHTGNASVKQGAAEQRRSSNETVEARTRAQQRLCTDDPCFVLALEVLDNLPYDKGTS